MRLKLRPGAPSCLNWCPRTICGSVGLNGIEFNLARAVGRGGGHGDSGRGGCHRFCGELRVVFRGHSRGRQMEKTNSKADSAGRNIDGSDRRSRSLRPQLPCDTYGARSDRHNFVLFQFAVCVAAVGGRERG